jgi:hypothetical protein
VGSGITCPPLDRERLGIYFAHLIASGFLPPPPVPATAPTAPVAPDAPIAPVGA